jgi:hypothetical protein
MAILSSTDQLVRDGLDGTCAGPCQQFVEIELTFFGISAVGRDAIVTRRAVSIRTGALNPAARSSRHTSKPSFRGSIIKVDES